MMNIVDLAVQPDSIREQAAALLVEGFREPKGWPNIEAARAELADVLAKGFAFAMLENEGLLGWVGGLPQMEGYQGRVCEMHPLVVRPSHRRRGVGRALIDVFEAEAIRRGALTATLGTDDDSGMTSLSDVNLYENLPKHLNELRDLGRGHPFLFYQKLGYVVTGVMPDANGPGRPDIYMSKSLRR